MSMIYETPAYFRHFKAKNDSFSAAPTSIYVLFGFIFHIKEINMFVIGPKDTTSKNIWKLCDFANLVATSKILSLTRSHFPVKSESKGIILCSQLIFLFLFTISFPNTIALLCQAVDKTSCFIPK